MAHCRRFGREVNCRLEEVNATIEAHNSKRQEIGRFIKVLNKRDILLTDFDDEQ